MPRSLPKAHNFINLAGRVFGRWTVIAYAGRIGRHPTWRCQCACGNTGVIYATNLSRGLSKSCGCLRIEITTARNKLGKHKGCGTPEYEAWCAIIKRCNNPRNRSFPNYGARGIRICRRWLKFENFLADMGKRPHGKSIDRIDNDGNYTPSNCRWATKLEQDRNRRTTRMLTYRGETLCVTEWAERIGINRQTIFTRLRKGWPIAKALG